MKQALPKVVIGIPAYNEESNISTLLDSLLSQSHKEYKLVRIEVISDASSDDTDAIVKSFPFPVVLKKNRVRLGQAITQNKLLDSFKEDILILVNADVLPQNLNCIDQIVKVMKDDVLIDLLSVNNIPIKPTHTIGKILSVGFFFRNEIFKKGAPETDLFYARAGIRAFSKQFVEEFAWANVANEDTFAYLSALKSKRNFYYLKKTKAYFKLPETLRDHINQSLRFAKSKDEMSKFFPKKWVTSHFKLKKSVVIPSMVRYFLRFPLYFSVYVFLGVYSKLKSKSTQINPLWEECLSTKKLIYEK